MEKLIPYFRRLCRKYSSQIATLNAEEKRHQKALKKRFFDQLRIYVRGGNGGQGVPKYGGVGGKGGDVVLVSSQKVYLRNLKDKTPNKRYVAASGRDSSKFGLLGDSGNDLEIEVPVGVTVKTDDGEEIADFDKEGQRFVVAKGGPGGRSDNHFLGQRGEAKSVNLILKLIADIGLVGFPNAGKSTILSVISRAKPKIANYPFTTLKPQIGTMVYDDHREITVADLPGLIEGAHENYGLGYKFLRHVERTKMLLFMVDIFGFRLKPEHAHRTAFETILLLNRELELYKEELVDKPAVLALNKIDEDPEHQMVEGILKQINNLPDSLSEYPEELHPKKLVKFDEVFVISAKHEQGTSELKDKVRHHLDVYADLNNKDLIKQMRDTDRYIKRSQEWTRTRLV